MEMAYPCNSSTAWHNYKEMIPRLAESDLRELLGRFPAVALLGPRQSGKTTLARALADQLAGKAVYVDLELPSDRAKLSDPEIYLAAHGNQLVILDEIHRAAGIFQTLRSIIDPASAQRATNRPVLAARFSVDGSIATVV